LAARRQRRAGALAVGREPRGRRRGRGERARFPRQGIQPALIARAEASAQAASKSSAAGAQRFAASFRIGREAKLEPGAVEPGGQPEMRR